VLQEFLDVLIPGRQRTLLGPIRWWLAVLAVPAAALLSASAGAIAGVAAAPFAPFYLALVVVAAWAGALPGLLTLILSVASIVSLGGILVGQGWLTVAQQPVGLIVFFGAGLVIVAVCHQLHRVRAKLRDSLERLTLVQSDVGIGLWTLDLATRELRTSESGWRLHGRAAPEAARRASNRHSACRWPAGRSAGSTAT